jgi:hypothetical protein
MHIEKVGSGWVRLGITDGSVGTFLALLMSVMVPSVAAAQSTSAFDGTYKGVSNEAIGGGPACDPFAATPRPLTIRNGEAQFPGGPHGEIMFRGHVSPQGDLKMQDNRTDTITGTIDPNGKATGNVTFDDPSCTLTAVWQKQTAPTSPTRR